MAVFRCWGGRGQALNWWDNAAYTMSHLPPPTLTITICIFYEWMPTTSIGNLRMRRETKILTTPSLLLLSSCWYFALVQKGETLVAAAGFVKVPGRTTTQGRGGHKKRVGPEICIHILICTTGQTELAPPHSPAGISWLYQAYPTARTNLPAYYH